MSEDSKPGDKGKYSRRRSKFLNNASAAIKHVYFYDRNEVIKCKCSRECFSKGKCGRNTHKKQQKAFQANGNEQKTQRRAYCQVQNYKPAKDQRELQQNQKRNKTLTNQVLPEVDYSNYNLKPKSKKWNEAYEDNYEIKPFKCAQEKVSKIYPQKQSNWSCVSVSVASSAMMQTSNDPYEQFQTQLKLPTPKPNIRSYENTVAVYSVYDQRPRMNKSKKETCFLGSGTSFSLQFYKSMGDGQPMSRGGQAYAPGDGRHMPRGRPAYIPGDGRQMFRASPVYIPGDGRQISRDGPAYILLPQNYSVSRLRRDEDGCICANIPQDDYGYENNLTNNHEGGSFFKRYLRVLMKEKKRCICRQHKKRQLRSCRTCRRNVGCQCKHNNNNDRINFLGNDAACQCKYRENGEHRSDRDSFYRERGITCFVPKTPTQCSRCNSENMFNTFQPQRPEMQRQTVNIGSNFSFKMRFYKHGTNKQPNPDDGCCYNIPACDEPCSKPTSCCSTPKLKCKSSSTKSARCGGDSCSCSKGKSNETICCCPTPQPDRCISPCRVPSLVPCKSAKTKSKNKSVASCVSTCVLPVYTKSKNNKTKNARRAGVCCGTICNMLVSKKSKCNKIKSIGCCCDIKPITVKSKRKCIEICCSTCKRPKKVEGYCCCNIEQKSPSLLSLISKSQSGCCCETPANNEPEFSLVQKLIHMFFKKEGSPCKNCNSMFNDSRVPTKDAQCGCKCQEKVGDFDYKKVLRSMTFTTERKRQARAQQCPCKGSFDYRKLFGRLLLFNVHEETCCSSETCGKEKNSPFSKSIGIGEADLRKPPCQRKANTCPRKNNYYLKKIFSRLITQETLFVRQQRMFDPLNQSVAAVQHCSTDGPNEREGKEIIYRNQGSSVPKCKQMTVKDYENSAMASPAEPVDPNQKTIRLGSSCSFSVELYRGSPPSKSANLSPPCPAPCAQPCAESPTANLTSLEPCSDECETPTVPFVQKAFASMILRNQKHLANKSTTCQRCNKCTKVPLIKRGFAQLLLTDSKQRKRNRVCQKTNTLQPVRRVVKRRPGNAAGAQGKPNCNPYVCLKRVNQSRCCNKTK